MITCYFSATEIQNIQIGEGDVCRNIAIPIYMVFPRLFTCPTLVTTNFKIGNLIVCKFSCLLILYFFTEFEVNLVVIFEDNHLITENFPIKLIRF